VSRSPYTNLYGRLVANTAEPTNAQACWLWSGRLSNGAYGRVNVYVWGLGDSVSLMAHIALWVWLHALPENIDDFYLAYLEFTNSGLELDHTCVMPPCCNPDHLDPVTPSENNLRKSFRNRTPQQELTYA
jgi:hypothetical protein